MSEYRLTTIGELLMSPPTFIPRALRCACTDAHHYRGSALCPLTPADPWRVDA